MGLKELVPVKAPRTGPELNALYMLTIIIIKVNNTNASRMGRGTVWSEGSLCLDLPVAP